MGEEGMEDVAVILEDDTAFVFNDAAIVLEDAGEITDPGGAVLDGPMIENDGSVVLTLAPVLREYCSESDGLNFNAFFWRKSSPVCGLCMVCRGLTKSWAKRGEVVVGDLGEPPEISGFELFFPFCKSSHAFSAGLDSLTFLIRCGGREGPLETLRDRSLLRLSELGRFSIISRLLPLCRIA